MVYFLSVGLRCENSNLRYIFKVTEGSSGNLIDVVIKTEITVQNYATVPDLLTAFQRNG